jgi:hypothetical protein
MEPKVRLLVLRKFDAAFRPRTVEVVLEDLLWILIGRAEKPFSASGLIIVDFGRLLHLSTVRHTLSLQVLERLPDQCTLLIGGLKMIEQSSRLLPG